MPFVGVSGSVDIVRGMTWGVLVKLWKKFAFAKTASGKDFYNGDVVEVSPMRAVGGTERLW